MLRMIFEDSEESLIGRLLKVFQFSISDMSMSFCGGNGMLQKYLEEHYNTYDRFIVYVDVVPDNIMTSKVFRRLKKYIRRNCSSNIFLVPIPCLEYYVLRVFLQSDFITVPEVIDFMEAQSIKNVGSTEQYYKCLLDMAERECYHIGQFTAKTQLTGIFYIQSCKCGLNNAGDKCAAYDLAQKSKDLLYELPLMKEMVFEPDNSQNEELITSICNKCVMGYNEAVNLYTMRKNMSLEQIMQLKI